MAPLSGKTAIVGIGATEFSRDSGRSEMHLALEAIQMAVEDAGLSVDDIDGFTTFTMDYNVEVELQRNLGLKELTYFSRAPFGGGGACAPLLHAAMAIATGVAKTVVCFRALNERSEMRFGVPMTASAPTVLGSLTEFHAMFGLQTPAAMLAMGMRRYMHETGAGPEDFAAVSISARKHAATNPKAYFYGKPLSLDEYLASRMIADPFRLFDCCQESDGAVAIVMTSAERAKDLAQKPVLVRAAAVGTPAGAYMPAFGQLCYEYRSGEHLFPEAALVARQLYAMSGLTPAGISMAIIYDHFSPSVLPALEAYGFCAIGEAKDFVKGGNIEIGGLLPVNTHGGQVGEAYIHGMNGIAEAVRQLRGTAANQLPSVGNVLVTGANGNPGSGAILGI